MQIVVALFVTLLGWCAKAWANATTTLVTFYYFAWGKLWTYFLVLLAGLGITIPNMPDLHAMVSSSGLGGALYLANQWIPLVEMVLLLGVYTSSYAAITPVKMMLRRVPGGN